MMKAKLVLIEGFPGAGKSTTTKHVGTLLQQQGIACRCYLEEDDPHPIACLDYRIKELTQKMMPLWSSFTRHALEEPWVTIIESRLWQNTALFMYMSNCEVDEIIQYSLQSARVLAPLAPILLYLDQQDTESALRQLYTIRGEDWMEKVLETTTSYPWFQSHGLNSFTGWVQFFEEWQHVVEQLYRDWPHRKIKILNPHDNWEKAYRQIDAYMESIFPGD